MATFKAHLKRSIQSLTANRSLPPVVVASMGRSGSTLVYDAVVSKFVEATPIRRALFGTRVTADWSWDLGEKPLLPGTVYKTHDYPDALKGMPNVKSVFLYGSTLDAAVSVYSSMERFGAEWVKTHFTHLKSDGKFEDIFDHDMLGFEKQVRSWACWSATPVICLKYEALWDNQAALSEFLGIDISLPPRRERVAASIDEDVRRRLSAVFSPVDERLEALPPVMSGSAENDKYFSGAP
jgi:hypothetical protein